MGRAPAKKPTSLLTNSVEVDRAMGVKCRGGHRHVHLMAGRARAAAHYPVKFCKSLCKGMRRQAKVDASDMVSMLIQDCGWDDVDEVTHVAEPWKKYWDDISGKELKPDLVRAAREEELKVVDEMGVWELRPISECVTVTGKKPVKVRWVDVTKVTMTLPTCAAALWRRTSMSTSVPICLPQLHHWSI